ncbi:hypothetical protein KSF78_0003919 [Schistosoma japonicum]|nr:hypothetical protein KSF78_0003919 [Schistosoma japonicum]KAH8868166.1 hypothetical protein KSF78_0003919 [Schistosoma japonicum]KAH8868167.1 hypothetical protein KSF78_0003919 [Schistosoma japonicum]
MPLTRNLLNEEINTIETDNNEKIEDVWFKSLIVKILLFVLGALLLLSIVLILIATALTHTAWFHRRKRSYYKRLDSSNKSKLCMKDYIVHYFCIIVETLAINSLDDNEAHSKHTKLFTPKQNEKTQETTSLPLRFQPEKLYGATMVSTKDKIRKGSCIDLPPYPQENRCRKKSMLDNFVFADQRRGSKVLDSTTSSKSNLSIHHSHLAGNEKRFFETGKSGMSAKLEPQDIPLIISDLSNQSFVDQNSSHNTSVSVEDLKSSSPNQKDIRLTVPIITRRASATDYELLDNRAAKSKRLLEAPISITVTDTQSEFDNNSTLKRDNINMRSTSSLLIEDPRIIRRNSFLSYYTVAETKLNDDSEPADDDKSVFSVNSPTSIDKQTKIESSASFTNIMEANKSILLNTDIDQEKNLFKRLPPLIAYEWMQFPAGIMAIGIRYFSKFRSEQGQILVTIYTVKNLLSARLWHKTIFNVHCTISAKDNSQTFIVRSKETEFGCPQFLTNNEVSMNIPLRRCSTTSGTSDIETPKVYIQLKIFESIPKWSGDKEYYHGSCSLSTEELSYGRKEFEYVGWCLVEEAYPIIRLSGDMLISICRNQNKGFVNIRIHEIRNMKFHSYGRWRIENLESLLANRSYEMTIHTCLINAGHIIKSIKAAKFHQYSRRASKFNEMNLNNLTEEKSREIKSNSFTLNDCSVQFSLPSVKKSVGKHLAVKHGITIYVKGKLPIADLIPYECSNQLKQLGITNTRVLHAIGECHFGDYGFQSDLVKDFNRPPSIHSSQGFSLWSDAGSRNGTRVYQWLRIE